MTEAWNGEEAAQLLDRSGGFDVLFTNVRMPGTLDGIALAEYARCSQPEIAVLVVSGYAENLMSRLHALNSPVIFLGKSYDLTEVVHTSKSLTAMP